MQAINAGLFSILARFYMLLIQLEGLLLLPSIVREGTNVHLVAAHSVALYALILVGVVESLDCSVAFVALEAPGAMLPPRPILKSLAVLWRIFEQVRGPAEVPRVMSKNTTLRIVAIFFSWTPTGLVEEHEKDVSFFLLINFIQLLVESIECKQTVGHEVILDALVLKVAVHSLD